jgi:DNA-binding CsgD family transcriptional regulator
MAIVQREAYSTAGDGTPTPDVASVDLRQQDAPPRPYFAEELAGESAGDIDEAIAWSRRAIDTYPETGEDAHALACALRLARRAYENGRREQAVQLAQSALGVLGDDGDADLRHDAHVSLASFYALQGRGAEAVRAIEQAATLPGERSLEQRQYFHLTRATVRAAHHGLADAFADDEEALRLAREIGDDERMIWTLNTYASRATVAGRTAAAMTALREAVEIAERRNFAEVASLSGQVLALAHTFGGDLANAQHWHERASVKLEPVPSLATSVGLRLAYLRGDDAAAEPYAATELRETAFRSGESQNIGLLAGSAAAYLDATGRRADARELRRRALGELRTADFSFWLLDQVAANDDGEHLQRARALLEDAARDPDHEAAHAYLALFDARTMLREGKRPDARIAAREAAQRFERLGWPWEHAQALEIAGERGVAQQMYTRHGCKRDAERVANARRRVRHRPSSRHLTQRELEVARLAADGHGNRAIAEQLHIGERTVETHIAAIFDRFDLTSRTQLRPLLERTAAAQAQALQE